MKPIIFKTLCLLFAGLLPLSLAAAKKDGAGKTEAAAERKPPMLSIDASPVGKDAKVVASYADVLEAVQKAVVSVHSSKYAKQSNINPMLREFLNLPSEEKQQSGLGSGVVVSPNGYILTNNHVIDGADELKVQLFDDREFTATVVGADPKTDIAVIKIDAEALAAATLADSDKIRVGDVVFALGNPLGVGQTVTMGIVSAVGRSNLNLIGDNSGYESFIQTDAAINMGNSGGALVDGKGRLIGINTAILSPSRGNIGIGFSVPINLAASIMQSLVQNNGVVHRGMLGIMPKDLTPDLAEALGLRKEQKGVLVEDLKPEGGPADKAGLMRGDVIFSINGKTISSVQELRISVAPLMPGSTVKVKALRPIRDKEAEEKDFDVILGTLDSEREASQILPGVTATELTAELRKLYGVDRRVDGVVIQDIAEDSPYRERLAIGLVIIEVNRVRITTVAELRGALKKHSTNLFYIYYKGGLRYLLVPMP